SPGAARGAIVFSAAEAERSGANGEDVILVRQFTSAEDVGGFDAARGILTSRGGKSSHAAIVARGMGRPCVCGAAELEIDEEAGTLRVGEHELRAGDVIALDGTTGVVTTDEVELISAAPSVEFTTVLGWADEIRRLGVRANADTGEDATNARELGAEGIGLCRTEHMFLAPDRLPVVRKMILADTPEEEADAFAELGRVQQIDFEEILEAMDGLPVTVRLLDPPLHEFLPSAEELRIKQAGVGLTAQETKELKAAEEWAEHNPMIGTRGVRLGVLKPGLYAMQVKALMAAAASLRQKGKNPIVEVMIPLTVTREEMALARGWVQTEIDAAVKGLKKKGQGGSAGGVTVTIGTMIETPRAAIRADEIAEEADFFSFGTNDLTQMAFGFSRDDIESKMMPAYLEQGLLKRNPFETIDAGGVGELVKMGVERGRTTKPKLKIGVCGEHGGDPESIALFYGAGLDYVSCSPFRVPIARLAAAQAIIASASGAKKAETK
ncbi:MAG: putative PEP-binding protein, partial [Ilumatobacteraceae bacterium]